MPSEAPTAKATLDGGRTVTLPVAAISHIDDAEITDHRIYVNESPLADG